MLSTKKRLSSQYLTLSLWEQCFETLPCMIYCEQNKSGDKVLVRTCCCLYGTAAVMPREWCSVFLEECLLSAIGFRPISKT